MKLETFFEKFDEFADAPDAVDLPHGPVAVELRDVTFRHPNAAEVSRVRTAIKVEFALIALIFVLAAGMARHGGLGL